MKRPEQALQIALVQWLDIALPHEAFFFAIPNAAKRGVVEGVMMKRMGTKAGVPDICIIHGGRALFLELKALRGSLSAAQVATMTNLEAAGAPSCVIRSIDEAISALVKFGVPLRAKQSFRRSSERAG